ncbi:hypothetical protein [Azovibrio restrictus]|uniref:hypothetical protein n=1 Tax=Azovibrio restrictus TaxID=146938 RepID=UPI0026F1B62F|nr:hypothetical protein [Azovibrio restrictus]
MNTSTGFRTVLIVTLTHLAVISLLVGCDKSEPDFRQRKQAKHKITSIEELRASDDPDAFRQFEQAVREASTIEELQAFGNPDTTVGPERIVLLQRRAEIAAKCAVDRMSTAAKTTIAKREHEARLRNIDLKPGVLSLGMASAFPAAWHPDIVGPLLRACDASEKDFAAQESVGFELERDQEYQQIIKPLNAEYQEASSRHEAEARTKQLKEDTERQQQEAWLFKPPTKNP